MVSLQEFFGLRIAMKATRLFCTIWSVSPYAIDVVLGTSCKVRVKLLTNSRVV